MGKQGWKLGVFDIYIKIQRSYIDYRSINTFENIKNIDTVIHENIDISAPNGNIYNIYIFGKIWIMAVC